MEVMKLENEVEINGKKYVLKSSIKTTNKPKSKAGKEYCIIRTYSAGVFAGWYDRNTKGKEGRVMEARRLWYWDGANSLSQLAVDGTNKPDECKFPIAVSEIDLKEIIEILPCTQKAKESIEGVPIWEK